FDLWPGSTKPRPFLSFRTIVPFSPRASLQPGGQKKMKNHHIERECISHPSDAPPEQRADIERALHGIFTERFGMRVADQVMPFADQLALPGNPTAASNSATPKKKRRRRPKPRRSPAKSPQEASMASHEARCT